MTPSKIVWPPERAAEIEAVKKVLRAAERLRVVGVSIRQQPGWRWYPGRDSWEKEWTPS
jgi:hypothetical protein